MHVHPISCILISCSSNYSNFSSSQEGMNVSISTFLSKCLYIGALIFGPVWRWSIVICLTYISLIISEDGQFFIYLLTIYLFESLSCHLSIFLFSSLFFIDDIGILYMLRLQIFCQLWASHVPHSNLWLIFYLFAPLSYEEFDCC